MACPFGVIRYRKDRRAEQKKGVAVKCDNCVERQKAGKIPACVETCKVGALLFGDPNDLLKKETRELSMKVGEITKSQPEEAKTPEAVALWRAVGEIAEKVS
jgi:carbon-monoxide dehydrogenase iron sulfur subunit